MKYIKFGTVLITMAFCSGQSKAAVGDYWDFPGSPYSRQISSRAWQLGCNAGGPNCCRVCIASDGFYHVFLAGDPTDWKTTVPASMKALTDPKVAQQEAAAMLAGQPIVTPATK